MKRFTITITTLLTAAVFAQSSLQTSVGTLTVSEGALELVNGQVQYTFPNTPLNTTKSVSVVLSNSAFDITNVTVNNGGEIYGTNCASPVPNSAVFTSDYLAKEVTVSFAPRDRYANPCTTVNGKSEKDGPKLFPGTELVNGQLTVSLQAPVIILPPGGGIIKKKVDNSTSMIVNLRGTGVDQSTGLSDANALQKIGFSPNPATEYIDVVGFVEIFDILGNKVAEGSDKIYLTNLKSGVYMVKTSNGTKRLVKN